MGVVAKQNSGNHRQYPASGPPFSNTAHHTRAPQFNHIIMPEDSSSPSDLPYIPPQYLLVHWTAAELALRFQEFCGSLRYVKNAPELVFERLVASLNDGFSNTVTQERAAAEELRSERKALQDSFDQVRLELAELRTRSTEQEECANVVQVPSHSNEDLSCSRPVVTTEILLEDDWTRLVFKFIGAENAVNVTCETSTSRSPVKLGGCTWPDVGYPDRGFQFGQEVFQRDFTNVLTADQRDIVFAQPFPCLTKVVVWLTHINYCGPLCIHVSASNVNKTGFTLQIYNSKKCILQAVGVAWAAYPTSRNDISNGSISASCGEVEEYPNSLVSGHQFLYMDLDEGPRLDMDLDEGPRVKTLVAINALDMGENRKFTLEASAEYSPTGPTGQLLVWELNARPKQTGPYSAEIAYICIG